MASTSTVPKCPSPTLSMRQGAMVLRGITRFINRVRIQRRGGGNNQSSKLRLLKNRDRRMGEKDALKCSPKLIERMKKETLFTKSEIEALYKIYKKLVASSKSSNRLNYATSTAGVTNPIPVSEGIDRTVFREILHNTFDIVTENMLIDRIFCVWDRLNCGLITLESWFQGMSIFLKSNSSKQGEYCFAVYDLNGDGFVTKDEMFQLLRNCLIKFPQEEDPDESVKDLVDIVIRKMDKDKDGKVSLEDYKSTVAAEPLLLEAFGRCLPTETSKNTFLATLSF